MPPQVVGHVVEWDRMHVGRALLVVLLGAWLAGGCLEGDGDFGGGGGGGGDDEPAFDCTTIPPGPLEPKWIPHPPVYEDLAFDAEGNLVGMRDGAIFKSPYEGEPEVFAAGMPTLYGLRYDSNGDIVAAVGHEGTVERIDESGVRHGLVDGLVFPNGVALDMNGIAYITDFSGDRVLRVDTATGEWEDLLTSIPRPNGITFDRWYKNLYICGWQEKILYKIPIFPDGRLRQQIAWDAVAPEGLLHGLGMDVCGNLYVTDIVQAPSYGTLVYRIPAGGGPREILWDTRDGGNGAVISNLEWGSGIGGWDANSIYLPNNREGGVYELPVGVPSRIRPYPPEPEEE